LRLFVVAVRIKLLERYNFIIRQATMRPRAESEERKVHWHTGRMSVGLSIFAHSLTHSFRGFAHTAADKQLLTTKTAG